MASKAADMLNLKADRFLVSGLDLLYPRNCESCGTSMEPHERGICWDCLAGVHLIQQPFCSCCGNPVSGRIDHTYRCQLCTENRPFFDKARSAARHEGVLQQVLMAYKYRSALWVQAELIQLLTACIRFHYSLESIDYVVPVPLFPARRRERGYNQAERLANVVANELRIPFINNVLCRTRSTETQTHLTARQRVSNVRGAFAVRRRKTLAEKSVLLIDDVMTTGATVGECAKSLKAGGAKSVLVATVARR